MLSWTVSSILAIAQAAALATASAAKKPEPDVRKSRMDLTVMLSSVIFKASKASARLGEAPLGNPAHMLLPVDEYCAGTGFAEAAIPWTESIWEITGGGTRPVGASGAAALSDTGGSSRLGRLDGLLVSGKSIFPA